VSTTRTDRKGRARLGRFVAAGCGLAAGVGLLALALPLAAGAAAALPGDASVQALRHRESMTDDDVLSVIASRGRALGFYGALDWRRELATASLTPRGGTPPEPEALKRSREQTLLALAQAPSSPQDWLRLAVLDYRLGDHPSSLSHLSTALVMGADAPRLRLMIVDLGFALWPELPVGMKNQVLGAVRNEWRAHGDRKQLMAQARSAGFVPLVALTLSGEADFDPARSTQLR
jgi:hypothetical protein